MGPTQFSFYLDALVPTPLKSQSCTERRCRPADLEGDADMFTHVVTSMRPSSAFKRQPLAEQLNSDLARFQREIQHL
jgi:hypothetical protein